MNHKILNFLFLFLFSFIFLLPGETSAAAEITGVVNSNSVNIRSGSGLNYGIISSANKGDSFPVLGTSNGWVNVKLTNGNGWIADYLIDIQNSPIQRTAINLANSLSVYQEASTRTAIIGVLNKNDPVTIQNEINGWYQVKAEKVSGWVYGNLLNSNFTVNSTMVNVYVDASVRVSVKGTLKKGDSGNILREINGWYFIESTNMQGWIFGKHLTEGSPIANVDTGKSAIVQSQVLDVYQQESMRSAKIGRVNKNTPVKIIKEINGWYQITSQNINGWVYGGLLNSSFSVSASVVNIYQESSLRTSVINQLKRGETGEVIQEINGWYYIKSGVKEGWIYFKHLTEGSPAAVINVDSYPAIISSSLLNVYQEASTRTPVIGTLKKDTPITVTKEINGWYKVQATELEGWVYGNILKATFTVQASKVNIYQEASVNSPASGTLVKSEAGNILREINGWYYIKSGNKEGWIYYKHLTDGSPAPLVTLMDDRAIVLVNNLAVYQEASTRTAIKGQLDKDQPVKIKKFINGWYQIVSTDLDGWVYGSLLKSEVVTTVNNVDVYLNSTTRTTIVATLGSNTSIRILKEINGWYLIESNAVKGWIYKTHLETGSPVLQKISAIVKNDTSIYYEPSATSHIIGFLTANQETSVIREVNGWYEIINNNERGWVPVTAVLYKQSPIVLPLSGKVIVLDAGHGGYDSGALGPVDRFGKRAMEKDLTLKTVKLLESKLASLGAKVILTRSTDVFISLPNRVKVSTINNADIFVSIHYNSSVASTVSGLETLYYYNRDIPLANSIQTSLVNKIQLPNRKAKYQDVHVLRENSHPSALVELGFISNPFELALIQTQDFQEKATSAIVDGIYSFLKK
ncbi:SH3 domain-containing protein [Neobacillus sp. MM2021_6]|uniref:SH3 domain-containing protein n=1 Tax=Bacillaceae TaxID=186817 RepID=UPI001408FD71|nr:MULTISPECIES: SH3 domain-containing protein [Bacillaceae]MBO0961642.1 SH3 domain-containing protein [Neobacillus sp. MM2021_6]